jgi:methionyl-tRNA formyltransferase
MVTVAFFGTPAFALPSLERLLASRHPVRCVVTRPDRPAGRGHRVQASPVKRVAAAAGLPVLQPERLTDADFLTALGTFGAEVGVVAAYGRLLPEAVLDLFPRGLLNVHASLLPKYRGAAPVQRAIMAGEPETGVTIMRVVPALDAGPILATARRPIGPEETAGEVEADLARLGADLLVRCLDDLEAGRLVERPQDEAEATYAPRITKGEARLDWTAPAPVLHNRVRGLQPQPGAYSFLDGVRHILVRTRPEPDRPAGGARPGEVIVAHGDDLLVAAGGGSVLRILLIQPEGRRVMTVRSFLAGRRLRPGMVFEPLDR